MTTPEPTGGRLDMRVVRCRCLHSLAAHPVLTFNEATGAPVYVPCQRCECSAFESRPTPWRVTLDGAAAGARGWQLTSPRGVVSFMSTSHAAAMSFARHLAGVDALLGRVAGGVISESAGRASIGLADAMRRHPAGRHRHNRAAHLGVVDGGQ